jgi:glucosamine kinase
MNAFGRADVLLLGIDGGGSRCRARLYNLSGAKLGEGTAGPARVRAPLSAEEIETEGAARNAWRDAPIHLPSAARPSESRQLVRR